MITLSFRIEHSVNLGEDRQPHTVKVDIPEPKNQMEKLLQEYVTQTIIERKNYHLLPFVFNSKVMTEVAKNYLWRRTGSHSALYTSITDVYTFCKWIGKQPDELIEEYNNQLNINHPKGIADIRNRIDQYILFRKESNLSPTTINKSIQNINVFFRINQINLNLNFKNTRNSWYSSR